jgi:oligopeptide/dipeptide ABC transporter ATP-binding protein
MSPILEIENLTKWFAARDGHVRAVNDVSFQVQSGEAVGLVGESGCGKTTIARCVLRLTDVTSGKIYFQGREISQLTEADFRPLRRHLQMVFQDPIMSLNPRYTASQTLNEPLMLHGLAKGKERHERLLEAISRVNLEASHLDRYPHQLSGGQKQRVGIARAIITDPECVLLDEPTSSLDMSVKIRIVQLLKKLQEEMGMTYIFISHDLSTVRNLCSRVMVMYLGQIVEIAPIDTLFSNPIHAYTRALLSAIPIPDPTVKRKRILLKGETPVLTGDWRGCTLQDRCPEATPACRAEHQHMRDVGGGHLVACRLAD